MQGVHLPRAGATAHSCQRQRPTLLSAGPSSARSNFLGAGLFGRALSPGAEHYGVARPRLMYSAALELARTEQYEAAREAFARVCTEAPAFEKAWVSWAQLEKRAGGRAPERFLRCRDVLQKGLTLNPHSAELIQAWGLLELQRGNLLAAVMLLDRCVRVDPARCSPVLRWKPVKEARRTVGSRRRRAGDQATA